MKIKLAQADWARVAGFYLFYACILVILAWPFCLPSGRCDTLFEWLWDPYLTGNSTVRFVFVVGFEYIVSVVAIILVRLKPQQTNEEPDYENQEFLQKVGVIIPCHKSAKVIGNTLEHALHHFPPENIVVMDNGPSEVPMDNCFEEVRKVSPDILYRWVPIGLKCMSLLLGSRVLPDTIEYVLLIDDDVLVPRTARFDSSYFDDENVSAVAYPIGGYGYDNTSESMNLVQKLQDFEFKLSDTFRSFTSQFSSVMFAHGAVSLWRKSRFTEIYSKHPGLPIGEDGWAGRLNLLEGYEMKHDDGPLFLTGVPDVVIPRKWWSWTVKLCRRCSGEVPNPSTDKRCFATGYCSKDLFDQRARRWDMNAPRRFWCHIKLFLQYGWMQFKQLPFHRALWYNIVFRVVIFRGGWALFRVITYIAYFVQETLTANVVWAFTLLGAIYVSHVLRYLFVNFFVWRKRKDLRVGLGVIFLMPLYRKILILFRLYGYTRSTLMYIPIVKAPSKVLGERDELREVWPRVRDQTDSLFVKLDRPAGHVVESEKQKDAVESTAVLSNLEARVPPDELFGELNELCEMWPRTFATDASSFVDVDGISSKTDEGDAQENGVNSFELEDIPVGEDLERKAFSQIVREPFKREGEPEDTDSTSLSDHDPACIKYINSDSFSTIGYEEEDQLLKNYKESLPERLRRRASRLGIVW